jgi:hypothetical protein
MSSKHEFMAHYGSREKALDFIRSDEEASYDSLHKAVRNPKLTDRDLIDLTYHDDSRIRQYATNAAFERGMTDPSISAFLKGRHRS